MKVFITFPQALDAKAERRAQRAEKAERQRRRDRKESDAPVGGLVLGLEVVGCGWMWLDVVGFGRFRELPGTSEVGYVRILQSCHDHFRQLALGSSMLTCNA